MSSETFPEKVDALSLRNDAIKRSNRHMKDNLSYSFYVKFSYMYVQFL